MSDIPLVTYSVELLEATINRQVERIEALEAALRYPTQMLNRIERLEMALREIMKATVEGRVCDDVAWFDLTTTLHDYCECMLASEPAVRAALDKDDGK